MPKEQDMNRITTKTGTLLIRVINDADGTADSANMTSANLAAEIASAAGDVTSVNGATGAVVVDAGDIAFTPAGTIAATTVQAAIEEVSTEGGGGGVTEPSVDGTEGQVLSITAVGPPYETGWVNASSAVDAAIAAHDAETASHGITDSSLLLYSTPDIGTTVLAYHADVPTIMYYTNATAATAVRPTWDGPVMWFNTTGQTDPTNAVLNDPIIKPVA